MFFKFFKLYKWYQIAQRNANVQVMPLITTLKPNNVNKPSVLIIKKLQMQMQNMVEIFLFVPLFSVHSIISLLYCKICNANQLSGFYSRVEKPSDEVSSPLLVKSLKLFQHFLTVNR